ncbi:tol-pal system protein YbgF [gamma proteobacterium HIMB55]|nr:tol-pal system protein YbgF [gamma proteobacterium HIMB55]
MIAQRFAKPVLVAGFFIFAGAATAQDFVVQPADQPSSIVPYAQADTSGVPVLPEPLPTAGTDARSLALRVQQLEEEIRRLNGLVEEQAGLLTRLQDQSLERYVEVDRRLAMMASAGTGETTGDSSAPSDPVVTANGEQPQEAPVAPEMGEQEAYQAAYGLVRERQFSEALTAFDAFLSEFPFGRFAPNAHYWLGELYLVVEPVDPEAARQNFQVLLDQYPNDRKVPDALYKLGRVHALKGNEERSREYLDRVIAEYGADGHPAAQLAQDFIDRQ